MKARHRRFATIALLALACAPAITVRPGNRGGPTVFRVESSAEQVNLVGTMSMWQAWPLEPRGKAFELRLDLPAGRYEYRLEVTDSTGVHPVFPNGAERISDGFGGENAVLRVP